ncbi:Fe(3+) ABC transporter substrate-binding protein [Aureibacillus halotolerans]|uniref:Iron(III) transport system substrate-binding protein n=1 Tax=Aureibacillus halotolerans TaxID=1508390 RepID=A0A4R6U0H6_9BACI|nr:Fe(3+) ABC transporter substrate-binding protein [Aureibacillus halotolerans]TDQ38712.1 iron(III) transport system substrate-binding protein [Aureibacillus halotolerans]
MKKKARLFLHASLGFAIAMLAACGADTNQSALTNESTEETTTEDSGEVNLYSARHYDVDKELYDQFEEESGIKVNVVEGDANELIERMKREGENSPADLFITVDGGILHTAKEADILQPFESEIINEQVPENLRDPDNEWVGLSTRARVIVYHKDRVDPSELSTYEDLATDTWKERLLVRSSTNLYNQSLIASLIEINGEEETAKWAEGIAQNLARDPDGGDRDQAKAVVAGSGDIAILNTYYVGQMLVSDDEEEVKVAEQIGVFFPNQETTGTHINISGAGLSKHSENKENAIKLVEFLTAVEAQETVSNTNFEYPVNEDAERADILTEWGTFKAQDIDFAAYGVNNPTAVELANKAGWK